MPINESFIRSIVTPQSFAKGQNYYDNDSVSDLEKRGDRLTASVEGSQYDPYQVTVTFKGTEFVAADCNCPYDFDGYCKHVVAVLLAYLHDAAEIVEKPPVETLLADLSQEQLLSLLTEILQQQPQLISLVEGKLARQTSLSVAKQPYQRRTSINTASFIQQVEAIFPSSRGRNHYYSDDEYYGMAGNIATKMEGILSQVKPFLEAGDGNNGLTILEAVIQPYLKCWFEYDDDGELGEVFDEIGKYLAEAILQADLTVAERKKWHDKITNWQADSDDYGVDESWEIALEAATQGWDYPPLQKALVDGFSSSGAWKGKRPYCASDLTEIRLRILARQKRIPEYLRLAEAEGQTAAYLTMLVQIGRIHDAMDYPYLVLGNNALHLAQALEQQQMLPEALQVAERGLSLHEPYLVAKWLPISYYILCQYHL